jgi:hypothetical protein
MIHFPERLFFDTKGVLTDEFVSESKNWIRQNSTAAKKIESIYEKYYHEWWKNGGERIDFFYWVKDEPFENLDEVFGEFKKPGNQRNTGWMSFLAAANVIFEGSFLSYHRDEKPGEFERLNQLARGLPKPVEYYLDKSHINESKADLRDWAEQSPTEVGVAEKLYEQAFNSWDQNDGQKIIALRKLGNGSIESADDAFNLFGAPGDYANKGWIVFAAVGMVLLTTRSQEDHLHSSVDDYLKQKAPNFPNKLSHYMSPEHGEEFIKDARQWEINHIEEVQKLEQEYRNRHNTWAEKSAV